MLRTLIAALVFVTACLAATPARAESSDVQVLAVASEKSFEHAQALTIALKRAVTRAEGYTLPKGDFSLEVLSLALGCKLPPDAGCQKKLAGKIGSERYIWGTLEVKGGQAVADLHLYEDGSDKRSTTVRYSSNLKDASDDTLLEIAAGAFAELMGATQGVLVVNAGNVSGEVFVDGEKVGLISDGRTELAVSPGPHEVLVRAPGFNDAKGSVTVRAGSSAELNLNPSPTSGGTPDDPTADSGGSVSTNKIVGYTAVGVGSVVALAGGYFWLRTSQQQNEDAFTDYRDSVPKGEDTCDVAKNGIGGSEPVAPNAEVADICDRNSRDKTMAFIMIPAGIVIAGVGAYFLVADDSSKKEGKPRPHVRPLVSIGPKGGAAALHVTF